MKKPILLLLLSIGLTSVSYASHLNKWTDDQLCGWMNNPPHLTHIVAEINARGLYCDGGVAIKTVKTPITKDLILASKLKSWNKIIRGKKPIYITNSGATIKVNPFGDEQSVILNKPF